MKVAVLYERSGIVRDAFIAAGHDAVSVDISTSMRPGRHIVDDVWSFLDRHPASGFDLIIAHPPCTFLTCSGLHHNRHNEVRQRETDAALANVRKLLQLNCPRVILENPKGCISSRVRRPRQKVQPYMFGHNASKETHFWTGDMMEADDYVPLVPTLVIPPRFVGTKKRWANQTDGGQDATPDRLDRWMIRSATYPGIAAAMAYHWGGLTMQSALRYLAYQMECLTTEMASAYSAT